MTEGVFDDMEFLVRELHKEWERSGKVKIRIILEKEDISLLQDEKPFAYETELAEKLKRQCELNAQLDLENQDVRDADLGGVEEERAETPDRYESTDFDRSKETDSDFRDFGAGDAEDRNDEPETGVAERAWEYHAAPGRSCR